MQFGRLDEVSYPTRRLDIGMIKQLTRCGEKIEPERAFERAAEQRIQNNSRQCAVRQDFDRMLVERGDRFDARRRMVHLVKDQPETLGVANAMPPVKKERADEPANEPLQQRVWKRCQMEQRHAG